MLRLLLYDMPSAAHIAKADTNEAAIEYQVFPGSSLVPVLQLANLGLKLAPTSCWLCQTSRLSFFHHVACTRTVLASQQVVAVDKTVYCVTSACCDTLVGVCLAQYLTTMLSSGR